MRGRLQVDWQDEGVVNQELENAAEAASIPRASQPISILANHVDRKMMEILFRQNLRDQWITVQQCRDGIRIQNQRQSAGSICSRSESITF